MMGSLTGTNLHQAEVGQYQRLVDAFFRTSWRYWRDVYQEGSLNALIYRLRQSAVLAMADHLGLPERSRVLEVGCGAGLTTVALAGRGYEVDAIDTVEAMIDLTRQAALAAGVSSQVKARVHSVLEMTFPSRYFDLVVAMGVLPWLKRAKDALSEMGRVIKPGGHIIVTADNDWCLSQMFDPLCFPGLRPARWRIADVLERLSIRKASRPRLHRHSIRQIDALLFQAGLQKVQGMTLGFGPFTLFKRKLLPDLAGIRLHEWLQALADRQFPGIRSTGTEYVVMARKPRAS
ncbi:MAG TPA: methyltransferase domain-containing protein [Terriglobia bacterium]|nr:methyltransferase domain-containing protein [Terriglobia bacterium]